MAHPNGPTLDPTAAEQFARQVVQQLHAKGYQALWAGGCVRDRLMGHSPKDYDVATSATPEQVQLLFGHRRTLAIGIAFGVVAVRGPRNAGVVEVATFRRDEGYSDGRHPDRVAYSTAEEDALRRDFTINGLFFDPIADRILDYVDGQADIRRKIIRCIGNPHERFDEDKLRMLRAVRFATVLGFQLEPETVSAVQERAQEVQQVSAERIGLEIRNILSHRRQTTGLDLLRLTLLWSVVLPEYASDRSDLRDPNWQRMMTAFGQLIEPPPMALACAILLWPICQAQPIDPTVDAMTTRWRLTNQEHKSIRWLLTHLPEVRQASQTPWPQLQRVLIDNRVRDLMELARVVSIAVDGPKADLSNWRLCQERLSLPAEQLNPSPLITGKDLQQMGYSPGPLMGQLLLDLRNAQLNGQLTTTEEAIRWIDQQRDEDASGPDQN